MNFLRPIFVALAACNEAEASDAANPIIVKHRLSTITSSVDVGVDGKRGRNLDLGRNVASSATVRKYSHEADPLISMRGKPRDWLSYLRDIPWELIGSAQSMESRRKTLSDIIESLSEVLVIEPVEKVQPECTRPPPLPVIVHCDDYPDGLIGERMPDDKPKLAHIVLFSFEVDVLEIHLNELYDVVDKFFIFESTRTNLEMIKKPLIWEKVRHQSRFRKFEDKIVHMIMDDVETMADEKKTYDIWTQEIAEVRRRFEKFIEWNNKQSDPFKGSDLIGFGDADEVPNRFNLHLLRKCAPRNPSTDIGIWFPLGRVTNAFASDWPVPGHPYTLGDPTFHTITEALRIQSTGAYPNRMQGKSGSFLLGGMHMTRARWLPFMILESMTCSECTQWYDKHFVASVVENIRKAKNIAEVEEWWDNFHTEAISRSRAVDIAALTKMERNAVVKLPWFLECNIERYPYWYGRHDTRLDLPLTEL